MESHRRPYRLTGPGRRRQAGITVLGFLLLATVFGSFGLAALKVAPLYLESLRVKTVLSDLKEELDGAGPTAGSLRLNLASRLYVEGVALGPEAVKVTPGTNGYSVLVQYDNRTRFVGNIWFLVIVDEQVEIRR
jgi:hypothetical protein